MQGRPVRGHLLQAQCSRVHQNTSFSFRKFEKNFWGWGTAPAQIPPPNRRGDLLPHQTYPRRLDPRASGAQLLAPSAKS